ncbi:MAG: 50S ribosomal protein L18 [Parcubacteria group bacterium]|nr:50S ribosomal protein L18 [Parcubacteria group bacterium]
MKIRGTAHVPRLSIFVSNKHYYAQAIDDEKGTTVASSSDKKISGGKKIARRDMVEAIGRDIAAQLGKGKRAVFDRGSKKYTGNVKVIADAAREAGLVF